MMVSSSLMRSLDLLPKPIDLYGAPPIRVETDGGDVYVSPWFLRAQQADEALTILRFINNQYLLQNGGGLVTQGAPHSGIREFNEYQRAARHNGDPVCVRLRRNPLYMRGLVMSIDCDVYGWQEAPFRSLTIRQGRDRKLTIVEKPTPDAVSSYVNKRTISDRDYEALARNAGTLVAAGFLLKRAVEDIYESKLAATSYPFDAGAQYPPEQLILFTPPN